MEKIAIISTRLGGIDGVSIEAEKWARAYMKLGLSTVFIAGQFENNNIGASFEIPEMDYHHPSIVSIREIAFNEKKQALPDDIKKLVDDIATVKSSIKEKLFPILEKEKIKYLSIENALSIPLNIPLGIALSEIISESSINSIIRHHDFYWERKQFLYSNVSKILEDCFPPDMPGLKHIVINSHAMRSIYDRKKIRAVFIPNIFDFDILKNAGKDHGGIKKYLEIDESDILVLQPTRLIARKKIERTIELVKKLNRKMTREVCLIISGKPEKNELEYFHNIVELARRARINMVLRDNEHSKTTEYSRADFFNDFDIYDRYRACDLVTLPSDIEGFGNPVIEASVFKKPLFVNHYPVLDDMLSKNFDFIVIDKEVDEEAVEKTIRLLTDQKQKKRSVDNNYNIAKKFYSMKYLESSLEKILTEFK